MKKSMKKILSDNFQRNFLFYGKINNKTSPSPTKNFITYLDSLDYEKNKEKIKIFMSNVKENGVEKGTINTIFRKRNFERLFIELFA
jgi:hypothetical protein